MATGPVNQHKAMAMGKPVTGKKQVGPVNVSKPVKSVGGKK